MRSMMMVKLWIRRKRRQEEREVVREEDVD